MSRAAAILRAATCAYARFIGGVAFLLLFAVFAAVSGWGKNGGLE